MRCKACDSQFNPNDTNIEGRKVEEELCGNCIAAVYDNTYIPQGLPHNEDFEDFFNKPLDNS